MKNFFLITFFVLVGCTTEYQAESLPTITPTRIPTNTFVPSPPSPQATREAEILEDEWRDTLERRISRDFSNLALYQDDPIMLDISVDVGNQFGEEYISIDLISQNRQTPENIEIITGAADYDRLLWIGEILNNIRKLDHYWPSGYQPYKVWIGWRDEPPANSDKFENKTHWGYFYWEDFIKIVDSMGGKSLYEHYEEWPDELYMDKTEWVINNLYEPSDLSKERKEQIVKNLLIKITHEKPTATRNLQKYLGQTNIDLNEKTLTFSTTFSINTILESEETIELANNLIVMGSFASTKGEMGDWGLERIELIIKGPLGEFGRLYIDGHEKIVELANEPTWGTFTKLMESVYPDD